MNRPTKKIFIIAGEPSGDQLGAGLMAALKKRSRDPLVFAGVGGPAMVEQGLQTLYPMRDLTVIGITEILPHVPRLMDRARQTIKAMEAFQPDVVITIDSPGFNNRVIEKGKKRGILKTKFVHYVAPTVWAYKPHRAAEIAKIYDHLMVILPFEQPYFAKEGLPTNFVGHPIVDDLDVCFKQRPNANIRAVNRLRLCLLAGSRAGEIKRLLPVYRKVVEKLMPIYPEFSITMPVSDDMVEKLRSMTADWPVKPKIVTGMMAKYTAFYESDVALCKSGTVTLEVAKCGLPLVMTYRANPISVAIVKRTLITKYFNLINVIQDREVIPERIQTDCTPDKLVAALRTLIDSPPAAEKQKSLCYEALKKMQAPGGVSASELAADTVLGMIKSNAFS